MRTKPRNVEPRIIAATAGVAQSRPQGARVAAGLAILALALPLGACGTPRVLNADAPREDFTARHPIVIAEKPVTIEILPSGSSLDPPTRARLAELARYAHEQNNAALEVLFPVGSSHDTQMRSALPAIRQALGASGVKGYISVGQYPVANPNPGVVSPIRISYRTLRAQVASKCGEWPEDLASGSSLETWKNKPYWNYGCSYQSMMANQVSDPRDLVEPRATSDGDVEMRIRAIGKVRQGADPGTSWTVKNSSIGSVGGG